MTEPPKGFSPSTTFGPGPGPWQLSPRGVRGGWVAAGAGGSGSGACWPFPLAWQRPLPSVSSPCQLNPNSCVGLWPVERCRPSGQGVTSPHSLADVYPTSERFVRHTAANLSPRHLFFSLSLTLGRHFSCSFLPPASATHTVHGHFACFFSPTK